MIMEYTMIERCNLIVLECLNSKSTNPTALFEIIANKDFVRIHGPEHHILDGACLLTAFFNAGGKIDLKAGLEHVVQQGLKMPGASCGLWGVCGAVTSCGTALAFIDGTGPLTTDESWGKHMLFTSSALFEIGKVGGPRCCKRDAFTSLKLAVDFVNKNYNVTLETADVKCEFSSRNSQCIKEKCPYFKGN